ncbi:hypothetical protein QUW35_00375 [Ligilactobacillus agilis]|uniref:hypothetical protein n=1 Tax=Ligilactobacillus agilis TaxID=1601 RepID=UPI0025A405DB|nr:hypothetical protein [Ligilactobacillus agilis]MDM8279151.1 hypothetical protein [Ligilactobacillus agilis]
MQIQLIKIQNKYIIINAENMKKHYYNHNQKQFIDDENKASRWPNKETAQKAFNLLTAKINAENTNQPTQQKSIKNNNHILNLIENYIKLANEIINYIPEVYTQLEIEEKEIQSDLLHTIEQHPEIVNDEYKARLIIANIYEHRQRRRIYKDFLTITDCLKINSEEYNKNLKNATEKYEKITGNRKYKYRNNDFKEYLQKQKII